MASRFTKEEYRAWGKLRKVVYARDNGICGVCGGYCYEDAFHLGHIIDHMVGGPDTAENTMVMHKMCNMLKPVHESRAEFDEWVKAGHWFPRAHALLKEKMPDEYTLELATQVLNWVCNKGEFPTP